MNFEPPRDDSAREFDDLARDPAAPSPDVTDDVMARLGFVRVSPEQARRVRLRRWATRASVIAMLGLAAYGAFLVRDASVEAELEAEGPAISAAMGQDLSRRASNLRGTVHLLRQTVVGHHDGPTVDESPEESPEETPED